MGHSRAKLTAYHEAGHAVMAWELRRSIRHVSTIPDEEKGSLGHMLKGILGDVGEVEMAARMGISQITRIRLKLEREAMIALAGSAAVALLRNTRYSRAGADRDWFQAEWLLSYLTGNGEELPAYVDWLFKRTKSLLAMGYLWQAVEELANELMVRKYIGGRRARGIIKEAVRRLPSEMEGP